MLDQFKKALSKVFGGKDLVQETFSPIASTDRSLPADIAEYVATGEPTSVLARAARAGDIAEKVGILSGGFLSFDLPKYSKHRKLIAELGKWDAPELLRLAQVYHAASQAPASGHQFSRQQLSVFSGGYEWLELFLRQVTVSPANVWGGAKKPPPTVSLKTIESMIALNQQDPARLTRAALIIDTSTYAWNSFTPIFRAFPDLNDLIERNPAVMREAFVHSDFKVRVHALETIAATRANALFWREEIAGLAVTSSKLVRE